MASGCCDPSALTSLVFLLPWPAQWALFLTLPIFYCNLVWKSIAKSAGSPRGRADWLRQLLPLKIPTGPLAVLSFPGGTTMWQVCFAVFVIPTAVVTALALVEILVYGGER